jgi:anti-anti-sigma regulatory factor
MDTTQGTAVHQRGPHEVYLRDESLIQDLSTLRRELVGRLRAGQRSVVIDISGIDRLSSPTVAALLWARRSCSARRADVTVRNPSGRSLDVLRRRGLAEVLPVQVGGRP